MVFKRFRPASPPPQPSPLPTHSPWHTSPPSYALATEHQELTPLLWKRQTPPTTPSDRRSRRKAFAELLMLPYRRKRTPQCSSSDGPASPSGEAMQSPHRSAHQAREVPPPRYRMRANTAGEPSAAFAVRSTETLANYREPLPPAISRMPTGSSSRSRGTRSVRPDRSYASCTSLRTSTPMTTTSTSPLETCEENEESRPMRIRSPWPVVTRKVHNLKTPCVFCSQETWQCANARYTNGFMTIPNIYIQVDATDCARLREYLSRTHPNERYHAHGRTIPMYLVSLSDSRAKRVQVQVSLAIQFHRDGRIPVVHVCDAKMEEISRSFRHEVNQAYLTRVPTRVCLVDELEDMTVGASLILRD